MKKLIYILVTCLIAMSFTAHAQQTTDAMFRKTLKEVLDEVQDKYHVKIKYTAAQVEGKWINYAQWRFRPNVDTTLANILTPLDLKVNKEAPGRYKLKEYEYFRWSVSDGWKELDRIAAQYHDRDTWEQRKAILKPELYKALELSPLPAKPASKPIITPKRIFDGYSVENIAIEILPGLYINGSLYKPLKIKGKIPVVLSPDGHWEHQRYRADCQIRCASLARMGAMAYSYDLFAWGESLLQFKDEDHRRSLAQTIQALGAIRILDYVLSLKETDPERVGISGGSGGGSYTVLISAMDDRIKLSAPVVSVSSYFYGGCPCESGMPIHQCGNGTDNVELAAMAAPRPQLLISDGQDWTANMPEHDFPYLQKIYGYYGVTNKVENVHLPNEGHDFGPSKRAALYAFVAENFHLDLNKIKDSSGNFDDNKVTIEKEPAMYVFGNKGEKLPANAIKGFDQLEKVFAQATKK
ncbi:acetylxylan esterase [Mucilaginibacter gossypii]|uniref:acetylxylan esterase n=1 Tax=Mucilaginibacter gossypii TaxID=551996 RepID=UPI000DCE6A83|nr:MULTISPECIES: acetylxylan esterase [Mucilaginibacter]QTE37184.1 acetylxylan esterase [Mucilaginibacter gossypii]RAV57365.1 acetylxylan esterase [Mucilaginibacter rubeus]